MKKRVAEKIRKRVGAALDAALVHLPNGSAVIKAMNQVRRIQGRTRDTTYDRANKRLGI